MASQKSTAFVKHIISRAIIENNKGMRAKLRKADNEATEYQSWEILARWTDLERTIQRKSYGLIGASIARTNITTDGTISIGKALQLVFRSTIKEGELEKSSQAMRLRRILACRDTYELIEILNPILKFIEAKEINYNRAQLLDDLLWFNNDKSQERIKTRWAQDFYLYKGDEK